MFVMDQKKPSQLQEGCLSYRARLLHGERSRSNLLELLQVRLGVEERCDVRGLESEGG